MFRFRFVFSNVVDGKHSLLFHLVKYHQSNYRRSLGLLNITVFLRGKIYLTLKIPMKLTLSGLSSESESVSKVLNDQVGVKERNTLS